MAKLSTITFGMSVTGDGVNFTDTVAPSGNANSPFQPTQVALVNGNNVVPIPANTQWAVVVPPTGSVVAKTSKGVATDAGLPRPTAAAWVEAFLAGTASFVINANGTETITIFFI